MHKFEFPGGKRFAFTIIDDTDVATVENVEPVYRLLERLGMRTTKTVWPLACPEGSRAFSSSQTLEDPPYLDFIRDLQRRGFEATWHGATMESSQRERTILALERFREHLGHYPRIHTSHAENRENLYWGSRRIDLSVLRFLVKNLGYPHNYFLGDSEDSPYWWGDLCVRHMVYGRNLTFGTLNVAAINPSMPYHDPSRPCVRYWFSCADAEDGPRFAMLLDDRGQEELESEGGFCIVATHFGKGFARGGAVHPLVKEQLEKLAKRAGWFPTAGELLDWLLGRRESTDLPAREWRRMQWLWARDLLLRRCKERIPSRRKNGLDRSRTVAQEQ